MVLSTAAPHPARRLASALVPPAGKRVIDRTRNRLAMAVMAPANREFVHRHGLQVSGGPFQRMRYLPGLEGSQGDVVTKLLGSYELELHAAVDAWIADPPALVVNVGSAEGYYAVGLAMAMPTSRVIAYDIDPAARALCSQLIELNGVADRVEIRGECTAETLAEMPARGTAVFSDCEGYELTLLDPARVPALTGFRVIAECHDFVDPSITETLRERFAPTHAVEVIASREHPVPDEVEFMSERQRRLVLGERPVAMNWIALSPKP